MFVHEDFKHLRKKTCSKLQLFPANNLNLPKLKQDARNTELGYFEYLKVVVNEYAACSSMHGINRIFGNNQNKFKRIIWIVAFLLCLTVFMYVSFRFACNYHAKPLVTVVSATHYPIFRIPFPEVTICNNNRFNWQRFDMAQRVFLRPWHQLIPKYQQIFFEVVTAFDTMALGQFYKFQNLTTIPYAELQELSYINFHIVAEFMAWRCHEIFSKCKWLDVEYSCCDIFFTRNSQLGSCLAFNTIESTAGLDKRRFDSFWPWRTKEPGIFNGLSVRVHLREKDHFPGQNNTKGILVGQEGVMLAEPSVWSGRTIEIHTHTQTSISIKGVLYTYDNSTRIISPKVRRCLFSDEVNSRNYKSLPNHEYMFENCRSECQQEYLVKCCNCTFSLFYPQGLYRPCQITEFPCLFYHNDNFRKFMRSHKSGNKFMDVPNDINFECLYNCRSLVFPSTITTAYMNNLQVDFNNSFIDLDVFFQKEFITVFLTTALYTLSDLMASFGGLAGLCIGCSLLSVVEIIYVLISHIPYKTISYYNMRKRVKLRQKSRDVKVHIMDNSLRN